MLDLGLPRPSSLGGAQHLHSGRAAPCQRPCPVTLGKEAGGVGYTKFKFYGFVFFVDAHRTIEFSVRARNRDESIVSGMERMPALVCRV